MDVTRSSEISSPLASFDQSQRRTGPSWFTTSRSRRGKETQRVFRFLERGETLARIFKVAIAVGTIGLIVILLTSLPSGRYAASWSIARARGLARRAVGLPPNRAQIDADLQRKRRFDLEQSRGTLTGTFTEYPPAMQDLLRFTGLDPDHALVRWGNFNRTVLLPATVFEADNSGRSYRFRPNVRSVWVRNFPVRGQVKAYFQVPVAPEIAELVRPTGAQIVEGSIQTTNSWGLRGPEPDLSASWRGIVLGDSYMQGLFVADDQTPTECLKRELKKSLHASVEVLNTGHLGYSPEQYYFTLREYADRFPPQFVVVSIFANDFGEIEDVLQGKGDWAEGAYWLGQIRQFCFARRIVCLFVPAPWVNQLPGPQLAGNYPGMIANVLEATGVEFLDPITEFAEADSSAFAEAERMGKPITASPLFNGRIGDGHFSPKGCELWAAVVGRRLELRINRRQAAEDLAKRMAQSIRDGQSRGIPQGTPTPRSP
jgi:hypothetical protein